MPIVRPHSGPAESEILKVGQPSEGHVLQVILKHTEVGALLVETSDGVGEL